MDKKLRNTFILICICFVILFIFAIAMVKSAPSYIGSHNGSAGHIYHINYDCSANYSIVWLINNKAYDCLGNELIIPTHIWCNYWADVYNLSEYDISIYNNSYMDTYDCMGLL